RGSYDIPWVREFVDRHLSSTDPSSLFVRREGPAPWGLWSVLFAVLVVVGARALEKVDDARPPEARFVQLLPEVVDAPALANLVKLQGSEPDSVVFHSYNWGGYLTWRGWKSQRLRNWIDDRNEVQGQRHIEATFRILAAEGDWQEDLEAGKVRFVCVEKGAT